MPPRRAEDRGPAAMPPPPAASDPPPSQARLAFVAAAPLRLEIAVPVLALANADDAHQCGLWRDGGGVAPATPPLIQLLTSLTSFFIAGSSGKADLDTIDGIVPESVDGHLVPLDPVGESSDRFGRRPRSAAAVCGDALSSRPTLERSLRTRAAPRSLFRPWSCRLDRWEASGRGGVAPSLRPHSPHSPRSHRARRVPRRGLGKTRAGQASYYKELWRIFGHDGD